MRDEETTVAELKQRMADFIAVRDWGKYHRPRNLAMSIAIEAAELMEHFQWAGDQEAEEALSDEAVRQQVIEESADILAFVLSLANCLKVDLASSFEEKMAKNELKYPAEAVRGRYERPKRQAD
jgi:dCTP diphosphatase